MKDLVLWDITSVGTAVLDLMHYFFSRKMLVLPLNSPMIYSYGGIADHVPWRKSEPSFWTFSPACQSASCLSKLQTMCIFFFNSKHKISTFQISIRLFNHELNVNHYRSKAVLRHLIYKKDCQTGHDNHAFQISKLYPFVNLRQQKDLCQPHNLILPPFHFWIKI